MCSTKPYGEKVYSFITMGSCSVARILLFGKDDIRSPHAPFSLPFLAPPSQKNALTSTQEVFPSILFWKVDMDTRGSASSESACQPACGTRKYGHQTGRLTHRETTAHTQMPGIRPHNILNTCLRRPFQYFMHVFNVYFEYLFTPSCFFPILLYYPRLFLCIVRSS